MAIPAAAQTKPPVAPNASLRSTDPTTGMASNNSQQFSQQLYAFVVNMCRRIPCNATGKNVITLEFLPIAPVVTKYADYDSYVFVAAQTSDGAVTALVQTSTGSLGTLKVYKNNGVQAGSGDVIAGRLYELIYNDALNSGDGGLLLDGTIASVIAAPTIVAVSGTGDDANINANFAALLASVNAIRIAIGAA